MPEFQFLDNLEVRFHFSLNLDLQKIYKGYSDTAYSTYIHGLPSPFLQKHCAAMLLVLQYTHEGTGKHCCDSKKNAILKLIADRHYIQQYGFFLCWKLKPVVSSSSIHKHKTTSINLLDHWKITSAYEMHEIKLFWWLVRQVTLSV